MDLNALKSYLVKLGFQVNQSEFNRFNQTLKDVGANVERHTVGVVANFAKIGTAIVGAYAAVGTATIALMNKVADADMGYQLFSQRMFMSTDAARKMKISVDALGYSLEEIAWNGELRERYESLITLQNRLQGGLGGDYEGQMRHLRSIFFEFTKFKVEMQYMAMNLVQSLFGAMGLKDGDILKKLRAFNDWVVKNIPEWSDKIAKSLVPVLKDIVAMGSQFGRILMNLTSLFIQFTGELDGDESLKKGEVNIANIAKATERWVQALTNVMTSVNNILETISAHPEIAKIVFGAVLGGTVGGPWGAFAGAVGGAGWSLYSDISSNVASNRALQQEHEKNLAVVRNKSQIAMSARELAKSASLRTGIPADLIFAQWAHETGNFTNRGATSLNNLAGIKNPGGNGYRSFGSLSDFADYWSGLMRSSRYASQGALGARTPEELAAALKRGGYYEDSYANYAAGMRRWQPSYAGGGNVSIQIGSIPVTVNEPNASPEQIQTAVQEGVREELGKRSQINLAQLSMGYQ